MTTVEGQLLSDAYPGGYYPGSLAWDNGMLKLGTRQSGAGPWYSTVFMINLNVIKACSKYAGGGLVLAFNAQDMTGSKITFWASAGPKDVIPADLYSHGGNCPFTTTPAPASVRPSLHLQRHGVLVALLSRINAASRRMVTPSHGCTLAV